VDGDQLQASPFTLSSPRITAGDTPRFITSIRYEHIAAPKFRISLSSACCLCHVKRKNYSVALDDTIRFLNGSHSGRTGLLHLLKLERLNPEAEDPHFIASNGFHVSRLYERRVRPQHCHTITQDSDTPIKGTSEVAVCGYDRNQSWRRSR